MSESRQKLHPLLVHVARSFGHFLVPRKPSCLLVAVSGGADSLALLYAAHELAPDFGVCACAVTVDHSLRAQEGALDARFVRALCARFSPPLPCFVQQISAGAVHACAKIRGRGVQDAARALRYKVFDHVAARCGAQVVLTAHTRDDQYETLLMRLFQGAAASALQGIRAARGRYVRPLLKVSRTCVEDFLQTRGVRWREDASNTCRKYVRNRIRHELIPALDAVLAGWRSGLDKTFAGISAEHSFCVAALTRWREGCSHAWEPVPRALGTRLRMPRSDFLAAEFILRFFLLQEACVRLGVSHRVPRGALERCARFDGVRRIHVSGLQLERAGAYVLFSCIHASDTARETKKQDAGSPPSSEKQGVSAIYVARPGAYPCACGTLLVEVRPAGVFVCCAQDHVGVGPFSFPFYIRTHRTGDTISIRGGHKGIRKMFSEWHVPLSDRTVLPMIEQDRKSVV